MSQSYVNFFNGDFPAGFNQWRDGDRKKPLIDTKTGVAVIFIDRFYYRWANGTWSALGHKNAWHGVRHWRTVDSKYSDHQLDRIFLRQGKPPAPKSAKQKRRSMSREDKIRRTKELGLITEPPPASEQAKAFAAVAEVEDERQHIYTQVEIRQNQRKFRELVFDNCGGRCVITGLMVVLEAAHLVPFADGGVDTFDNGLLMRVDIHRLFDAGYMAINPADMSAHFITAGYAEYEGRIINTRKPVNPAYLAARWEAFTQRTAA
jgi:hypothetical protein